MQTLFSDDCPESPLKTVQNRFAAPTVHLYKSIRLRREGLLCCNAARLGRDRRFTWLIHGQRKRFGRSRTVTYLRVRFKP